MTTKTSQQSAGRASNHSVSQAINQTIQLPDGKRPRVLVSGYYGFNNLGDDLILHVLVTQLMARGLDVTVLSNNPIETKRMFQEESPSGGTVDAIHRMSLVDIFKAMTDAHLFICGGGGLFQDRTSIKNVMYYGAIAGLARFLEIPVCMWAQGVGPLNKQLSRWIVKNLFNETAMFTVRDTQSAQLVSDIAGFLPEVTADPVWLLDMPEATEPHADTPQPGETWNIGISLREWPELTADRLENFARVLGELTRDADRPVQFFLLPMMASQDLAVLSQLRQMLEAHNIGLWKTVRPEHVMDVIPQCHMLFGMRYHSLLLALLSGVQVYGLVYDPKVRILLDELGLEGMDVNLLEALQADTVASALTSYPKVNLEPLKQRAYANFEEVEHVLEKQSALMLM